MQGYSDDDIKNAAEIREWLTKLISEKQDEIERIKITLSLIDSVLKHGSFKTAAHFNLDKKYSMPSKQKSEEIGIRRGTVSDLQRDRDEQSSAGIETRQIKRIKDNSLIATVEISRDRIEIIPEEAMNFNIDTPPFKSFFLNRILEGMKNKDLEKVKQGHLDETQVISFNVVNDPDDTNILKKIQIQSYRDKERINEIFNTVAWVFTRMLEKSEK